MDTEAEHARVLQNAQDLICMMTSRSCYVTLWRHRRHY